jgi:hypothetical protein
VKVETESKLRIKDEFKKSGYFWLPSAPEKRIPGTLVITDSGNIELEVVGLFDETIEGLNRALNGKDELERIMGLRTFVWVTPIYSWSCGDDLECSWFPFWVEIKTATMEVDSGPIVISISVAASKAFHLLDFAVEAFSQGIGYPVPGIGYDVCCFLD